MFIFGTRPEAIKLAPVIRQIKNSDSKYKVVVCVTAQHRSMLDPVLTLFDIIPDYDLDIMKKDQTLFDITTTALTGLSSVLGTEKPDIILVQGDTTTAMVASLAAYYFKIPVGHVEAGLRTYNKYSPFPEEKNRHVISVLSDYHFAPTDWSQSNLLNEGIKKESIWVTGNTVTDSLLMIRDRQMKPNVRIERTQFFKNKYNIDFDDLNKILLVTGHRRENFGNGFENICLALKDIARLRPDVMIVYPVHLNPNVQKPVYSILHEQDNIFLIDPLEYEAFVFLMNEAYLVLTDSGGIQEEAPSLGKPVLVMRDSTERPEGVDAGVAKLIGTKKDNIFNETLEVLNNKTLYKNMSKKANPYGDGMASGRIFGIIRDKLRGDYGVSG